MSAETAYKVEANVDLPKPMMERYPFAKMAIGDSFAVASQKVGKVRAAACQYGKRHQAKFSVRLMNPLKKTYRCWRIA